MIRKFAIAAAAVAALGTASHCDGDSGRGQGWVS
jgi:hypothetical protein